MRPKLGCIRPDGISKASWLARVRGNAGRAGRQNVRSRLRVSNDRASARGVLQARGGFCKEESLRLSEMVIELRSRLLSKVQTLTRKANTWLSSLLLFTRDPLADLSALEAGLAPRMSAIGLQEEEAIVKRILVAYSKAKSDQQSETSPYGARGEWDRFIKTGKREYVAALERAEVANLSRLLKNFFRNTGADGLLTISNYGPLAAANRRRKRNFIYHLLQDYYTWTDLTGNISPRQLAVPAIGNPWGYIIENQLVMPGACRHNYFAHQARLLVSEVKAGRPVVAEIGGGFGGLAYFLLSSGINCCYIDFDLPEILVVAQYYLISAFPEKRFLLYGEESIDLGRALESYDVILMPNFELPKLPGDSVDLFINTGSLSEMDYATVEEYIGQITRVCRLYFFHDNSDQEVPIGTTDVVVTGNCLEVPSSRFPIQEKDFRRIYKAKSPWVCMGDRMREHLYQRIAPTPCCASGAAAILSGQ